jgi:hypothetical protein
MLVLDGEYRLKRVFAIEIERCRRCGGRLEVIASIEDPARGARATVNRCCTTGVATDLFFALLET